MLMPINYFSILAETINQETFHPILILFSQTEYFFGISYMKSCNHYAIFKNEKRLEILYRRTRKGNPSEFQVTNNFKFFDAIL